MAAEPSAHPAEIRRAQKLPLTCDLGAEDGIRTRDPNLGKVVRYRCATSAWTSYSSLGPNQMGTEIVAVKWPFLG
jgi:hypothetical protein